MLVPISNIFLKNRKCIFVPCHSKTKELKRRNRGMSIACTSRRPYPSTLLRANLEMVVARPLPSKPTISRVILRVYGLRVGSAVSTATAGKERTCSCCKIVKEDADTEKVKQSECESETPLRTPKREC